MMNLFNLYKFFFFYFMKPQLVDLSKFNIKVEKTIIKPPTPTKVIVKNNGGIIINCIFIMFIFIGIYFLYQRYQKKEENKLLYNKKIENLYNIINKYGS